MGALTIPCLPQSLSGSSWFQRTVTTTRITTAVQRMAVRNYDCPNISPPPVHLDVADTNPPIVSSFPV